MSEIAVKDGGIRHPILNTVYSSPLTAAVLSKLVHQPTNINNSGIRDAKDAAEVSRAELFQSSLMFQNNMRDQENAMELFPDLEMTKQTIISLILAPNNMTQEDLNYAVKHPLIPPDLANKIIELTREQIENHYRLPEKLFKIIEEAMFTKGAHVRLVLPESAVDHLINERPGMRVEGHKGVHQIFQTFETEGHGFLGSPLPSTMRMEDLKGKPDLKNPILLDGDSQIILQNIEISDNFGLLKEPLYQESVRMEQVRNKVRSWQRSGKMRAEARKQLEPPTGSNLRVESFDPTKKKTLSDTELKQAIYKNPNAKVDFFLRIPESDNLRRHSIGRPLDMVIPPEAMIPVHFPGQPDRHIGSFVLVDPSGYFLNAETQRQSLVNGSNQINAVFASSTSSGGKDNMSSSLLEKARQGIKGADNTKPLTYLAETFGPLLEEDLLRRIRNGVQGSEAALARNNDIYAVMIARALSGQNTQVIYLPKEFYTYFAFQHNANGTGRSHLADVKYLISLRAISLFAKIANQVRNAISITDINVELDPRDPSPQRTMEKIIDLSSQTRSQFFPWGLNTPSDIANWWHRAGMQMHVTGHKGIPATKIEYSQRQHDKNVPNIDDDEVMNNMIHMHFGVTPEMRDSSKGAQFATSIANQNILLTKRVMQFQNTFNALLSDYFRVIASNDTFVANKIRKLIAENWGKIATGFDETLKTFAEQDQENAIDYFLNETIDSMVLELPRPDLTSIQNQFEAFKVFKEAVEETFDYIISDDAVSQSVFGQSAEALVAVRLPLKAQLYRDWMQRNNFLPELFDLLETDSETSEGKSTVAIQTREHLTKLAKNIISFMEQMKPVSVGAAEDLNSLSPEPDQDQGY